MKIRCFLLGCRWDSGRIMLDTLAGEKYRRYVCQRCGTVRTVTCE